MKKLIETAKELDRLLKSGLEIHPNSPIHERLQRALNIAGVSNNEARVAVNCRNCINYGKATKVAEYCSRCTDFSEHKAIN